MTDSEWQRLAPFLLRSRGRPPANLRATWDAIFWVACSAGPWKDLPPELGKPDTAHRALRRALDAGTLQEILFAVSRHPVTRGAWADLAWRVARAWRRMTRRFNMGQLLFAKRLGLRAAMPCHPGFLPKPQLSETIAWLAPSVRNDRLFPVVAPILQYLHRSRAGQPRRWRLTD